MNWFNEQCKFSMGIKVLYKLSNEVCFRQIEERIEDHNAISSELHEFVWVELLNLRTEIYNGLDLYFIFFNYSALK